MTAEISSTAVASRDSDAVDSGEGKQSVFRFPGVNRFGAFVVVLALISAAATFVVLAGLTPIEPSHEVVIGTLLLNIVMAVVLLAVIGLEIRRILLARRRGFAGAQLHGRVVAFFTIVAAAPAILLAVVAAITLDRGLDRWFSVRARAIVDGSLVVARAYLEEHARSIRGEVLAMANDLNRAKPLFDNDPDRFKQLLTLQAQIRNLPSVIMYKTDMTIVGQAKLDIGREMPKPPEIDVDEARSDEPTLLAPGNQNAIGAVLKLSAYDDIVLFVTRPVDPRANQYLRMTEQGAAEYQLLQTRRFGVQVAFGVMYVMIALTLLLAALWVALAFANKLVAPIRRLIAAAEQVAGGNLYVQVPYGSGEGDLGDFTETFNKMTAQLRTQRNALLEASAQIDKRRRFTETVLAGVPAGVVGIDDENRITLLNRTAERLLGASEAELLGRPLAEAVPEAEKLLEQARGGNARVAQGTISITRGGRERVVSVRITTDVSPGEEKGLVVTLDDITELVSAQRTSAWADVARRIAHEIKNPLTPIQLSAERIRRKYGKVITEDREVFDQCTDTIVRQVDDIKRMVDEFSSFARMPKATIAADDVAEIVKQVVVMMRVGFADIEIVLQAPEAGVPARFDRRLLSQAVTNIIKNAAESVQAVPEAERGQGRIEVGVAERDGRVVIDVVDNGVGLPQENRSRLLEPYMTTREKGTGLGLAIVGKIMEDHGGAIELLDAPAVANGGRGALVRLWFPAEPPAKAAHGADAAAASAS